MINIDQLIVSLQHLSDADFQRKAWLASEGPVVSSFSEDVCQVFDDTGLSIPLDNQTRPSELDEQTYALLQQLDSAVSRVDQSAPPEVLLRDPQVEKVRQIAARALARLRMLNA